jgi:DNA-directed RNA polymerase specialized sigma24 family protein
MHVRDYVEEMMLARLTATSSDDLPDSAIEHQFKQLIPCFEIVINKVLWNTHIEIFTDDDLTSFMYLKAHQLLRQQKYDDSKNPYSFFYTAFTNLMRDIIRSQERCIKRGLELDIIDVMDNHLFGLNCDFITSQGDIP